MPSFKKFVSVSIFFPLIGLFRAVCVLYVLGYIPLVFPLSTAFKWKKRKEKKNKENVKFGEKSSNFFSSFL